MGNASTKVLKKATANAEKALMQLAADAFKSVIDTSQKRKWYEDFNSTRKRWIWAIQKVIVLNTIGTIEKRLMSLGYASQYLGQCKEDAKFTLDTDKGSEI